METEERLFVTYTSALGEFFGQFEKRPEMALKDLEAELVAVYSNLTPATDSALLLYADVLNHVGDYGVIKWKSDGNFYRVKITKQNGDDVSLNESVITIF